MNSVVVNSANKPKARLVFRRTNDRLARGVPEPEVLSKQISVHTNE